MFSLVLPAHNEAPRLENSVKKIIAALKEVDYEIIIAEDGSTDGTYDIAKRLEKANKRIRVIHAEEKLGRGKALKRAFSISKGDSVGYIDVDLATDLKYLPQLIEYSKKYDMVTGSRYTPGAKTERPLLRKFFSTCYNIIIRIFLGCKIYDSQCGFKAFSRRFVEKEIANIKENTWAWDTVVLVEGIKKGYSFKEFPVEWTEMKEKAHSASFKRIYSDVKKHGLVLLKLFAKWRLGMKVEV
ncbi:MAG: glycosyltransferase [Candidatus Aenigmatarchaeota archaeon]